MSVLLFRNFNQGNVDTLWKNTELQYFSYDYLSGANSEPSQTSKMECFANIVNHYRKTFDLGYLVCFWIRRIRVLNFCWNFIKEKEIENITLSPKMLYICHKEKLAREFFRMYYENPYRETSEHQKHTVSR